MKYRFILILILSLTCTFCSTANDKPISFLKRAPSSEPTPKTKTLASNDLINKYLKLQFAKDGTFKTLSKNDCKAFASKNEFYCVSKDCLAILKNQNDLCVSADCKALIDDNSGLCQSKTCLALIKENINECEKNDTNCQALFNHSYCKTGDCEGYIKEFAGKCETPACRAITQENMMECESN
jgi:hypothetical protein